MGQIGTLRRISTATFNEAVETEIYPPWERNKAYVDVDKLWEAIMYIVGKGNIDHDLAVYLFIPRKMAVLEEGEYMSEGIHYHDHDQIHAYCSYFEQNPVEALISSLDIAAMEKAKLYVFDRADLSIIKDLMHKIVELFQQAKEEGDIIIGHIG